MSDYTKSPAYVAGINQHAEWLLRYLAPLEGATVERVEVKREDEFGYVELWPVLHVRTAKGEALELELSQDEEGNGPGFLFGLPHPDPTTKGE